LDFIKIQESIVSFKRYFKDLQLHSLFFSILHPTILIIRPIFVFLDLLRVFFIFLILKAIFPLILFKVKQLFFQLQVSASKPQLLQLIFSLTPPSLF